MIGFESGSAPWSSSRIRKSSILVDDLSTLVRSVFLQLTKAFLLRHPCRVFSVRLVEETAQGATLFRVLREAVRIFLCQTFAQVQLAVPSRSATIWIYRSGRCNWIYTWHRCWKKAKFGGGLGAVRTGIALFWATKAPPCTICKVCKAA